MRKYLLAFGITACAFALTFAARGAFQQSIFSFFTCAVAIIAYSCGTAPAVIATALAVVAAAVALLEPIGSLRIQSSTDLLRLFAFAATATLIIAIVDRLRTTQQRLRDAHSDLEYIKTARGVWNWSYDVASDRVTWSSYVDAMEVRQERNLRGWLELLHPEDRRAVEGKVRQALQTGDLEIDYRMQLSDKSMVRFLTRAKMLRERGSDDGRLVGISMEPISPMRVPAVSVRPRVSATRG